MSTSAEVLFFYFHILPDQFINLGNDIHIYKCKYDKVQGRYWGSKSYKRYGTDEEYWDENLWIGFHPPCVIYLADITCVSTSSMLLSSKTRVLAFGR